MIFINLADDLVLVWDFFELKINDLWFWQYNNEGVYRGK
jgi:hypothetical protein